MYRYETHLHTCPVSLCARATVEETVTFYKEKGYDGIFITDHFLDGNTSIDRSLAWEEKINAYCSAYEQGVKIGEKLGIKVFFGVEMSYRGTDFLIYGLDKQWYLSHPEIMDMKKSDELRFLAQNGAFIVQAHPYREAQYIDHIRLFPRLVHGVEVINGCQPQLANSMAHHYADMYKLIHLAGSDNHRAALQPTLAGVESEKAINSVEDFISMAKDGLLKVFTLENKQED